MALEPKNIPLKGLFPLPVGLEMAPVDIRGRFWKWLGSVALRLKRAEIFEGIDRFGNKFLPVRRKWGEPTPLLPHGLASRTYRLLTYNWSAQAATLYWKSEGGRESWPTILGYHAYKHGPRRLPVRNTIGLSPRSVRALEEQARIIWRDIGPSPPPPAPKPKPKPKGPKPKPRPIPEPPPPPPIRLSVAEDRRQMAEADRLTREAMAESRAIMEDLRRQAIRKGPVRIPPGRIEHRIEQYALGDHKVAEIVRLGSDPAYRAELQRLRLAADAARDELYDVSGQIGELDVRISGEKDPKRLKKLWAEWWKIDEQRNKLLDIRDDALRALAAHESSRRAEIHRTLELDRGINIVERPFNGREPDTKLPESGVQEKIDKAIEFVRTLAAPGDSDSLSYQFLQGSNVVRAYHSGPRGVIVVDRSDGVEVTVHEIGHALEYVVKTDGESLGQRAREFLEYRTRGEVPTNLRQKFNMFDADEEGRKDRFDSVFDGPSAYYVGKYYESGSTEITSMGLQLLYSDPIKFAENDPEYLKFVLGMLDGSLR